MSDVNVGITVDTSQAEVSINEIQQKMDELTLEAKVQRNTLLREIREGFTMISSLMSSFRQAMSLFGQSIDPFFSALVGSVLALSSMLISSASVLASTVVLAPLGAIIFGLAVSFQILTIGKLLADQQAIRDLIDSIKTSDVTRGGVNLGGTQLGGSF